jgi:hypothetical protein
MDELTLKEMVEVEYQWQAARRWYWLRPEAETVEPFGELERLFAREAELREGAAVLVDVGAVS